MAEIQDFIRLIDQLLFLNETGYKLANDIQTQVSAFLLPNISRGELLNLFKKLHKENCLTMIRTDKPPGTFGSEILDTGTDAKVLLTIRVNQLRAYKQELKNNYLTPIVIEPSKIEKDSLNKEKIDFDSATGVLNFNGKQLLLNPDTTIIGLCRYMFKQAIGVPVDWSEIYESIEDSPPKNKIKDRKRIYDAMVRLNKEIKKQFLVNEGFLTSKNTTIRRNF